MDDIHFHLDINGKKVQQGDTKDLLFTFDNLIAYVSKFFTLKKGDLIFTGTPKGVGKISENDLLEAYLKDKKLFSLKIQ